MAEPMLAPAAVSPADRDLFSLHPEEHMTERPVHRLQGVHMEQGLRWSLPGWYVAGNMGVYWVLGEMEYPFVGPDVFVARNPPAREGAAVYLTYEDGPLIGRQARVHPPALRRRLEEPLRPRRAVADGQRRGDAREKNERKASLLAAHR
jgi:hypothetical protein